MRSYEEANAPLQECFSFRCDRLRNGDVLLSTHRDDRLSGAIRTFTGGSFSHAAICTSSPTFIEATLPIVAEFSLSSRLLAQRQGARILRLKQEIPDAGAIAQRAARAAEAFQVIRYDVLRAATSLFGGLPNRHGVFCSFVVAAAYAKAGLMITNKPPEATTPADIEHSPFFEDVTDSVIVPRRPNPGLAHFFVDRGPQFPPGTEEPDKKLFPAQKYNIGLQEATEKVSRYLKRRGLPGVQSYGEALKALDRYAKESWFAELDELFAKAIIEGALPTITKLPSAVEYGRKIDFKILSIALAEHYLREEVHAAWMSQIIHLIARKEEACRQRNDIVGGLKRKLSETGYKTAAALLKCEENLQSLHRESLADIRLQFEWLRTYAQDMGWPVLPSNARTRP